MIGKRRGSCNKGGIKKIPENFLKTVYKLFKTEDEKRTKITEMKQSLEIRKSMN